MATYMVILVDDDGNENWSYPTEIEASDKQDALNAICENVPRDTVKTVLTVQEYKNIINKKGFGRQQMLQRQANMQSDQFQNSNDFFNNITNAAMQMAEQNENSEIVDNKIIPQNNENYQQNNDKYFHNNQTTKYFEDNGIFFKLENNILYKKCWETIDYENQEDKSEQYRIINTETNKIVNNPKYAIQKLTWKQLTNS